MKRFRDDGEDDVPMNDGFFSDIFQGVKHFLRPPPPTNEEYEDMVDEAQANGWPEPPIPPQYKHKGRK